MQISHHLLVVKRQALSAEVLEVRRAGFAREAVNEISFLINNNAIRWTSDVLF